MKHLFIWSLLFLIAGFSFAKGDLDYENKKAAPSAALSFANIPSYIVYSRNFTVNVQYTANFSQYGLNGRIFLEIRDAANDSVISAQSADNNHTGYEGPSGSVAFTCNVPAGHPSVYFLAYISPIEFNQYIINELLTYPRDGSYTYQWSGNGVTHNIDYLGTRILSDNQAGNACYCSGITYEVFMDAWDTYNTAKGNNPKSIWGITTTQMADFRRKWYAADGNRLASTNGVLTYNAGFRITDQTKVRTGDVMQIWRNSGSGHSVFFDSWVYNDQGEIESVKYWSTQTSTNGINYNTESYSAMNWTDTSFVRILKPIDNDDYPNRYADADTKANPTGVFSTDPTPSPTPTPEPTPSPVPVLTVTPTPTPTNPNAGFVAY